jgi:hypothetical protein
LRLSNHSMLLSTSYRYLMSWRGLLRIPQHLLQLGKPLTERLRFIHLFTTASTLPWWRGIIINLIPSVDTASPPC